MSAQKTKKINRTFHQNKIINDIFNPIPLDVKLVSNPFLKDQQKYQFLIYKIKQYNQAIIKGQVNDSYHAMVQDKLNSLLAVIANLQTRDLQIEKLNQVYDWFMKQEKLIEQRKNQGDIRYKITKDFIDQTPKNLSPQFVKSQNFKKSNLQSLLPSQAIAHENLPFLRKWRTTHKQLQVPEVRLKQYNRKSINFNPLSYSTEKQVKKVQRVKYPKLQRIKYIKQYQVEQGVQQQQNKNESVVLNPQNTDNTQKKQGQQPINPQIPPEQQQQQQPQGQDLGLGQQPQQQPQQQQEQQQQDKLAPRLKSFVHEPKQQTQQQKYSHKRMNERYLKLQNDYIKKQSEDSQFIQMMHSWAARKSQLDKQIMKRIQNMGINFQKYKHSYQEPQKQQYFSVQDAKKYGLNKTFDLRKSKVDVDLTQGLELPNIKNKSQMFEKSIRKDKLEVLKKKFGKMLNIKDYEQRQVVESMCQVAHKKKGFSQLLRKHSKSKQRIKQLDQAVVLKQKLARQKISIDISVLSKSLCAPEDQEHELQGNYPLKNLISNPFWVEPAKKKKKKK